MALVPNKWTERVLGSYVEADVLTEAVGTTTVKEGWYLDPTLPDPQLIERIYITRNTFDTVMYKSTDRWEYTRPGSAPHKHYKLIECKAFLPVVNTGRQLITVQEEFTVFWTFTPWAKDVLAFRKHVDAFVVYDKKPTADLDAAGIAAAEAKGYNMTGLTIIQKEFVIDNARMWDEAIRDRTIVEKADANQGTMWVENVITEETDVQEEPDRFTIWIEHKNQIRPDDNRVDGPQYHKREAWVYNLEVPVLPPTISVRDAGVDGILVEVKGGGADIPIPLIPGEQVYHRGPEQYRVFRKKIEEPEREPRDDPYNIWLPSSAPERLPRREIIENTFVGSPDGTPIDSDEEGAPAGLPSRTDYTEPHDPGPVDPDNWRHVVDVKNQAEDIDRQEGFAITFDPDTMDEGEYKYVATAVVQDSESPLSNEDSATKDGDSDRSLSMSIREREDGTLEADIEMPSDDLPPGLEDYGETLVLEV
jgi:hypothetical protein